jgi:phage baseplate assembly protein W
VSGEGLGIKLPYTRSNKEGYFAQVETELDKARTNLMMLLMTSKGERPMMPTYGSDLKKLLFSQNIEGAVDIEFEDAVVNATSIWMKSVAITDVNVSRDPINNPYQAEIKVTFELTNIPDSEQELDLQIEV